MNDYGMNSDEGNARVQEIIDDVCATAFDRDGFLRITGKRVSDRLLTREEYATERLEALARDDYFSEADSDRVRDLVHKALS